MNALVERPKCPRCDEQLSEVLQYVTEQREYTFRFAQSGYVGRSDPVDDTANLDYLVCPTCLERLPRSFVEELFRRYDALNTAP